MRFTQVRAIRTMAGTLLLILAACSTRDAATSSDSARVDDSLKSVDSAAAAAAPGAGVADTTDLVPVYTAPPNTSVPVAGETRKPGGTMGQRNPPRDSIIGRDSAFGPIGEIDSKGNVRPIKR